MTQDEKIALLFAVRNVMQTVVVEVHNKVVDAGLHGYDGISLVLHNPDTNKILVCTTEKHTSAMRQMLDLAGEELQQEIDQTVKKVNSLLSEDEATEGSAAEKEPVTPAAMPAKPVKSLHLWHPVRAVKPPDQAKVIITDGYQVAIGTYQSHSSYDGAMYKRPGWNGDMTPITPGYIATPTHWMSMDDFIKLMIFSVYEDEKHDGLF